MRWSSILTLLCVIASLILTFLCLFAGSSSNFLQNGDLLTLNMSRLGHNVNIFNTTDGDGGFFDNLVNGVQEDINDLVDDVTSDIAASLNISDFYSVHIMNYCEGVFKPNASLAAENGTHVSKNTTYCSPRNAMFHFNVTQIVQDALPSKINLTSIDWPQTITDAQDAVRTASIATEILYIIAIALTGLAFFAAIAGFFTNGRMSACCNVVIDTLAFIALVAASAVATTVILKVVDALNKYGQDLGIHANRGNLFLGMTWAATGLMFVATIISFIQVCVGRRNGGYITSMKEKRQGAY
ncbi:hypothetical protein H2198_003654 [Neophaeococcomyces mojaviensis]|uniref:Uncharacterized protein n=1 Tax=Neophaeococcomyces mojaviensis TaxID=3383035 RepID=A0ACC3ABL3_9EURO|nr:hypothetical protein H2198_003654 [Knufia sp. JES_112]